MPINGEPQFVQSTFRTFAAKSIFKQKIMIMKREKKDNFDYPRSVQSDLFGYLKPAQQEFVRPVLRALKKLAQVELCCMLLDYMETGEVEMGNDIVVGGAFLFLTRFGMGEAAKASDPRIVRPLCLQQS